MRNSANKLHTKLTGDVSKASQWVPFARNILDGLIDVSGTGSTYTSKTLQPEDGTRIIVRLAGAERFIHIDVRPPCTDRQGFLLTRTNDGTAQTYTANYVDGFSERINPITGTPRPDPDPAKRTKGQKVPSDLFGGAFAGKTPAKFSGLIRKAVGCYHMRGLNIPFSYTWGTTHGIVEKTVSINNGTPVKKHWIVEISSLGVYAAPISDTGKCCDSWDVSMYQPTAKELEDNPGWQTYKTTLSLWWAATYGNRSAVYNVIGNMAEPYDDGSPWSTEHGWAFSASGNEVMAVVAVAQSTPESHYDCSRWTIAFGDDGQGNLTATLTPNERKVPFAPLLQDQVWLPTDSTTWTGITSFPASGDEIAQYPAQNAPIHVYYDGEAAIVTRYSLAKTDVAAFQTPPISVIGGTINYNGKRIGNLSFDHEDFNCYSSGQFQIYNLLMGGVGFDDSAYTLITAGYSSPKQSHVTSRYSVARTKYDTQWEDIEEYYYEQSNTYGLRSECYFIRDVPPPTLITACTSIYGATEFRFASWQNIYTGSEDGYGRSAVVLFGEEREAILHVFDSGSGEDYSVTYQSGWGTHKRAEHIVKIDGGDCPLTEGTHIHIVGHGAPFYTAPPSYGGVVHSNVRQGGAQLDLGSQSFGYTASIGPEPFFTWDNYDLGGFLDYNQTTKPTHDSDVFAIHGNLYYDEADLTPVNQRNNAVYWIDGPKRVEIGGFESTGEIISFVGRA